MSQVSCTSIPKLLHGFHGALLFCCICIYMYFRTLSTFEVETSEFLEKCYVNISWTGGCKLLPVLCSPRGGENFEMGQGFHCEPVIVFQTVWGSGGARKCVRFLPSSGTVVWAGSRWIQNRCACSSSTIHTCKRAPCCSALCWVFKGSSARSVLSDGRMYVFVLCSAAVYSLFFL